MNEPRLYFEVQSIKRTALGNRTYTESVEKVNLYKEEDYEKALKKLFSKKHNHIVLHKTSTFDDIPYVRDEFEFGDVTLAGPLKRVVFKRFNKTYVL